jgi:hypothetical protein
VVILLSPCHALPWRELGFGASPSLGLTPLLRWASDCKWWWSTAEQLDEAPQVLRGRGQKDLIFGSAQTTQSKSVEPEDTLHMREPHLDLLALPA